jgi:hypothetical protein
MMREVRPTLSDHLLGADRNRNCRLGAGQLRAAVKQGEGVEAFKMM